MAESRGGKEDRRLKTSFERLLERGTEFVEPAQFQRALTSRQLKVKPKSLNVAGLQLADMVAYPSRDEILHENDLTMKPIGPFSQRIITILQGKYDRREGRIFGKKLL